MNKTLKKINVNAGKEPLIPTNTKSRMNNREDSDYDAAMQFSQTTRKAREKKRIEVASAKRIQGHESSLNKRNQKSRDVKNTH